MARVKLINPQSTNEPSFELFYDRRREFLGTKISAKAKCLRKKLFYIYLTEEQRDANEETEGTKEQIRPAQPPHLNLAKNSLDVGQNRQLELECRQGSSGQKTINICMIIVRTGNCWEFLANK
jgi:hypothetical protein